MVMSQRAFLKAWKQAGEDTSPTVGDVAWRRYQQIQSQDYQKIPESSDPSPAQFSSAMQHLINSPGASRLISSYKFISIPSNTIPWLSTDVHITLNSHVSTFSTGRIWRSRLLDYYLPPQFVLYFRVGVNGQIFNATHDTNTFESAADGEIYLALQFPGAFGNSDGGRVQGPLSAYDPGHRDQGSIELLIIVWKEDTTVTQITEFLQRALDGDTQADPLGLISSELNRLTADPSATVDLMSAGWEDFWFIGTNAIFSTSKPPDSPRIIRCRPDRNVGILQKTLEEPTVPFGPDTVVSWEWCVHALPSRLREDTRISHDYLSVAFEFENGRDLTYTWSWELAVEFGYWCPLPGWEDREYHVVIRTGREQLSEWLAETRDLWADYVKYVNEGDDGRVVPKQVVRVWLIAGNRWQRYEGDMMIRNIHVGETVILA